MSTITAQQTKELPDKMRPAATGLIRRVRRLWQDTPGVRLSDMAAWIGNRMHPSTLRQALWGDPPSQPLTVGECDVIIERIQAVRAARGGAK